MDSFMTIAYVERNKKGLTINCSGPDGNAFQLLRTASDLGKQMGKTQKQVIIDFGQQLVLAFV